MFIKSGTAPPQLLFPLLATLCQCITPNYPTCLAQVSAQPRTETFFNNKFIAFTEFMVDLPDVIAGGFQLLAPISTQSKQTHVIVLGTVGLVCLCLTALRFRLSHWDRLRACLNRNLGFCLTPALITLCIVTFTLTMLFTANAVNIPDYTASIYCSHRHLEQLILHGDNQTNWAGLHGYVGLLELYISYYRAVQGMGAGWDASVGAIARRRDQLGGMAAGLQGQYTGAVVEGGGISAEYRELLLQLFGTGEYLQAINESTLNVARMADLTIVIENLLSQAKMEAATSIQELQSKKNQYQAAAHHVEILPIFQAFLGENWQSENFLFILLTKVLIGLSASVSVCYCSVAVLSLKTTLPALARLSNVLWLLLQCTLLLCIIQLYFVSVLASQQGFFCPQLSILLSSTPVPTPSPLNTHLLLSPCLRSQPFADPTQYSSSAATLTALIGNLSLYMAYMDDRDDRYLNTFAYSLLYNSSIDRVRRERTGQMQSSSQAKLLLDQIEEYTMQAGGCYKHKWVWNAGECSGGATIVPNINSNLLVINSSDYSVQQTRCLLLHIGDGFGRAIRPINYSEIMSNYMDDYSEPACRDTIGNLSVLFGSLANFTQAKQQSLLSLQHSLQDQRVAADNLTALLRRNYLLKKQQTAYLKTLGTGIFTPYTHTNWDYATKNPHNCSTIRSWAHMLNDDLCVGMRATVLRMYLCLLVLGVALGGLLGVGAAHGLEKALWAGKEGVAEQTESQLEEGEEGRSSKGQ